MALLFLFISELAIAGTQLRFKTETIDIKKDVARVSSLSANDDRVDESEFSNLLDLSEKEIESLPIAKFSDLVIQFEQSPTHSTQSKIESLGLKVHSYLPDDALIVSGLPLVRSIRRLRSLKSQLEIRAIAVYRSEWKRSAELDQGRSVFNADQKLRLHVRFLRDAHLGQVQTWIQGCKTCQIQSWSASRALVDVPRRLIPELSKNSGIEFVELYRKPETMEFLSDREDLMRSTTSLRGDYTDLTGYESGTFLINAQLAHAKGLKGQGQIIAVADGGLDTGNASDLHPDFGNFLRGFIFGSGVTTWRDTGGHGTHVAGSALGQGTLSNGRIQGSAPEAKLIVASLSDMGIGLDQGLDVPSDVESFVGVPYSQGARIHTNSWSTTFAAGLYTNYSAELDEFVYSHPDMLILFAASNDGCDANRDGRIDEGSVAPPGTAKNVLTVGASKNLMLEGGNQVVLGQSRNRHYLACYSAPPLGATKLSDNPRGLAPFSARGPTRDGRLKPEVVAPGTNIVSVRSRALSRNPGEPEMAGRYNASYLFSGGTSMATPIAAGGAAIVRQFLIQNHGLRQPSAALVKAVMMHTADDLFPGQFGEGVQQELTTRRPNVHLGFGRINLDRATSPAEFQVLDDTAGVETGEVSSPLYSTLAEAGHLMATLVYTDAPASSAAALSLVNDLALVIKRPDGETFEIRDGINNFQTFESSSPLPAGTYEIRVRGHRIPRGRFGKQAFALVVSSR